MDLADFCSMSGTFQNISYPSSAAFPRRRLWIYAPEEAIWSGVMQRTVAKAGAGAELHDGGT